MHSFKYHGQRERDMKSSLLSIDTSHSSHPQGHNIYLHNPLSLKTLTSHQLHPAKYLYETNFHKY